MNIKEILRYMAFNTKSFKQSAISLRFTLYSICNDYKVSFCIDALNVLYININNLKVQTDKITLAIRPFKLSVMHVEGQEIVIPSDKATKDEWFNFNVQHGYSKDDFYPEITKIHEILKISYNAKYMEYVRGKI